MSLAKAFDIFKKESPTLSAGVISADLMNLGSDLSKLEKSGVRAIHFDVMDGNFVPALTVGPLYIESVKTPLVKDVHLMISDVEKKAADYVKAGADILTVHIEECQDALALLKELGGMKNANNTAHGVARGIAISPATPVESIAPLLHEVEMIVLLAVDPAGAENPAFEVTQARFKKLKKIVEALDRDIILCVDGGVKKNNIADYVAMGADLYVSGSALFAGNLEENAKFMLDELRISK
ncbi:MAG TPA: ribulose-phosphate 3-epimerase [Nitrospinota bacterium]|nr:ribulose-phosphate 3-epimerase [Nitrospinota bacterium]|tara:strand:+ start:1192 stop:1908 length:717 start_codon:yes stop_codon:yes gene_type:complete